MLLIIEEYLSLLSPPSTSALPYFLTLFCFVFHTGNKLCYMKSSHCPNIELKCHWFKKVCNIACSYSWGHFWLIICYLPFSWEYCLRKKGFESSHTSLESQCFLMNSLKPLFFKSVLKCVTYLLLFPCIFIFQRIL